MALPSNPQERLQLFFQVGGHVFEIAEEISGMVTVEWKQLKGVLNPELVDRAKDLHQQGKMDPVDALIQAARECREQQLQDVAAQCAQPFGEQ
ncbi:MAG: hypothetical protein Q7R81_04045 [Candidatus Peregrinibacteria bacterium]|nr:hypothetical protein [Candidatus Peregrinibacteria bacterium]